MAGSADDEEAKDLEELSFSDAKTSVVTNVDAAATKDPAVLRDSLIRQVSSPVRWFQSMSFLIDEGIRTFAEVGPGKVLSGLMRQISRDVNCFNVEDVAGLRAAVEKAAAHS